MGGSGKGQTSENETAEHQSQAKTKHDETISRESTVDKGAPASSTPAANLRALSGWHGGSQNAPNIGYGARTASLSSLHALPADLPAFIRTNIEISDASHIEIIGLPDPAVMPDA
jgi:hypothetical protein